MRDSAHITPQQMSDRALGERDPRLELHLQECLACRTKVSGFDDALSGFRQVTRGWSDDQFRPEVYVTAVRPGLSFRNYYWALLATMAFCVLVIAPLRRADRQVQSPVAPAADSALLKRVDMEISRTVPGPMEPLMELVSWDGETGGGAK